MEKRAIFKNSLLLSLPSVARFFIGLGRAKIVAIYLGTSGTGIVNQLQTLLNSVSSFTTAGMPDGMVKQIAKANSNNEPVNKIASIIKTYAVVVLLLTVLSYSAGFIFSRQLTIFIFGDINYLKYFYIGFTAFPIMIISSSSYAIIKAYKKIKSLVWADLIIAITSFIFFVLLVIFLKLTGAIIYVVITIIITALVYRKIANNIITGNIGLSLKQIIKAEFIRSNLLELFSFAKVFIIGGVLEIIVNLISRSVLVKSNGIDSIGIYSPVVSWSGLFMGFILPSITTYLFPRFCEAKSDTEIIMLLNNIIRLLCIAAIPFVLFCILLRNIIIPFFYSKEFLPAGIFLPFHFVSIYFTIINYSFAQIFAPTGRLKQFIPIIIFNNLFKLVIVFLLVPRYGLWGWVAMYSLVPIISSIIYYLYWKKTIKFSFNDSNRYLFLLIGLSSLFILIFRNYIFISGLISALTLVVLYFIMEKSEKKFLLNILFLRTNK